MASLRWLVVSCAALCSLGQLIGEGSRWPLDNSFLAGEHPFIAKFGNEPTKCLDPSNSSSVVPCKQIHILEAEFFNDGPIHIVFALSSGLQMAAHWINRDQLILPGYELVLHGRNTGWSASVKDEIIADEFLGKTADQDYVGTMANINLDGGWVYIMDRLRVPMMSAIISQRFEDADRFPTAFSPVNHGGHAFNPTLKVFEKCGWKSFAIISDTVQFGHEAQRFRADMGARGYAPEFSAELTNPGQAVDVVRALKRSRTRVVMLFAEAQPIVWLVCEMHLQDLGRIVVVHWPGIPWILNAADAQHERCRSPAVLMSQVKHNYIGFYPMTMDASPTTEPLTCHPNIPKADAQGQVLGYMQETLAEAKAPFGAVPHLSGGFDIMCMMTLYLQHMLFVKNRTVEELSARTPEVWEEYLNWSFPSLHGASGHINTEKVYGSDGKFNGQRRTNLEIIQINGNDMTKTPYLGSSPPWDMGMIFPNYEVKPDGSIVDGFLASLAFEDGAACPADRFDACPSGQELRFGHCTACAPGRFLGDDDECTDCPAGMHQPKAGSSFCMACAPGMYSNETGQSHCTVCEPGYSRPVGTPSTQCLPCGPGTFAPEQEGDVAGLEQCELCPVGSFTEGIESTRCVACPQGRTTAHRGSDSALLCQCPSGTYMNDGSCLPCPEGMTCAFGSELSGSSAVQPRLQPGFWASAEEPVTVYSCMHSDACPGDRLPGDACGPHLMDRACAHCDAGYIMVGKQCIECTPFEESYFLFPLLPLFVGPLIAVVMILQSGDDEDRWGSWKKGLAGLAFVIVNHYQVVTLLRVSESAAPPMLTETLAFWEFTSDVSVVFRPPCVGVTSFLDSLVMKALSPIAVLVVFFGCWACSRLLARFSGNTNFVLNRNNVQGCCFNVLFVFFAGIAQAAFLVMKCAPNPSPNQSYSLVSDRSVACYEGLWYFMLIVGLLAALVWCVGLCSVFSWAIWVSRRCWGRSDFRMRWKFLFVKFRPGCASFSILIMLKGVLTNIGFIFLVEPVLQVYWAVTCLAAYMVLIGTFRPWRISQLNVVDMISQQALIFLGFSLAWFLDRSSIAARAIGIFGVMLSLLVCFASAAVLLQVIATQKLKTFLAAKERAIGDIVASVGTMGSTDEERLQQILGGLVDHDFAALATLPRLFGHGHALPADTQDDAMILKICEELACSPSTASPQSLSDCPSPVSDVVEDTGEVVDFV